MPNETAHGDSSSNDIVGYKNPPAAHKFKKGVSGNPRGRPKNRERAWTKRQYNSDVMQAANAETTILVNGKRHRISMQMLIIRQIFAKAAKGDHLQAKLAMALARDAALDREKRDPVPHYKLEYLERDALTGRVCDGFDANDVVDFLDYQRKKTHQ